MLMQQSFHMNLEFICPKPCACHNFDEQACHITSTLWTFNATMIDSTILSGPSE